MSDKKTKPKTPSAARVQSIEVLRPGNPGVTFSDALDISRGKRILSNLEADAILQDEEKRAQYKSLFQGSAWTSTMFVHEAPGVTFGTQVTTDYFTMEIPKQYRGKVDQILSFDLYDCTIRDDGSRKVITLKKGAKVRMHQYPREDGWYFVDPISGIPTGAQVKSSDPNARYLWQRDDEAWIGPLVRWGVNFGYFRRYVDAYFRPVNRRGVGVVVGATVRFKKGKKHRCNCRYCTRKGGIED